jgi:hypothetical protein
MLLAPGADSVGADNVHVVEVDAGACCQCTSGSGNRLCKPGHAWLPVDAPSGCQCVAESRPTGLLPGGLGAENRSTLQVVEWFGHIFPTVLQKTPRNKINHKKTQNKINHPEFSLVLLSIRTTTWQVFSRRHFPLFHHVKSR